MKTYQQCKDEVLEIELGLTWDDWMLHHELPKGRFVQHFEQQAADMYADQFKKVKPEPTEDEIMAEATRYNIANIEYMKAQDFALHMVNWYKKQINR